MLQFPCLYHREKKKSSFPTLQSYYEETVREESCRGFGKFIRKTQRPPPSGPSDSIALENVYEVIPGRY